MRTPGSASVCSEGDSTSVQRLRTRPTPVPSIKESILDNDAIGALSTFRLPNEGGGAFNVQGLGSRV